MVCWLIQEDPTYCIATKPRHLRAHALQLEATAMRSPHTTRESLHTAAKNQHSQKYIFFKKVFQVLIPHSIKKSSKRKEKFPTTKQWKSLVSHETQARRLQGPSIHGAPVVCVCVCVCVCVALHKAPSNHHFQGNWQSNVLCKKMCFCKDVLWELGLKGTQYWIILKKGDCFF